MGSQEQLLSLLLNRLLLRRLLLSRPQLQLLPQLKLRGSRLRGVQLLRLLQRLKRQGNNKLLLLTLLPLPLLPKRTLLTPKSARTLVPMLTLSTTLSTRWPTMKRIRTSQGTRSATATSSPALTSSSTPLEPWSLLTTLPVWTVTPRHEPRRPVKSP